MDIVSRLKTYINHKGIPVTQFADSCNIPRPTLSQLLNGRNKKVSDELIGKIHEAFPDLSVLWLMFGEGNMLCGENIETSEPKTASIFSYSAQQSTEKEQSTPSIDFNRDFSSTGPNNFSDNLTPSNAKSHVGPTEFSTDSPTKNKVTPLSQASPATITFNSDESKRIVNIIIYYSDNSFESFVPNR